MQAVFDRFSHVAQYSTLLFHPTRASPRTTITSNPANHGYPKPLILAAFTDEDAFSPSSNPPPMIGLSKSLAS
jgi:hypothetical protein